MKKPKELRIKIKRKCNNWENNQGDEIICNDFIRKYFPKSFDTNKTKTLVIQQNNRGNIFIRKTRIWIETYRWGFTKSANNSMFSYLIKTLALHFNIKAGSSLKVKVFLEEK